MFIHFIMFIDHRSFLLTWRLRPDTFASTSLCPTLSDAPPFSHSFQTSSSFTSAVHLQVSSSSFTQVFKLTQPLHGCLKMSPKYLQDFSRIVSLTGLVLIRRCIYSYEIFIGHLILVIFKHTRWNLPSLSSSVPKEMKTDTKKVWHCFIELCSIFSITSHYNSSDLHIVKTNQGQATGLQFS